MESDAKKLFEKLNAKIEDLEKQLRETNDKVEGYASACATLLANVSELKGIQSKNNQPVGYTGSDSTLHSRITKWADLLFDAVAKRG